MIVQTAPPKLQTRRHTKAQDKMEKLNKKTILKAPQMPVICISIPDTPQVSPAKTGMPQVNVQFNLSGQVQKQINPPVPLMQQQWYQEASNAQRRKKKADSPPPTVKKPNEYKQLPLHRHISSGMASANFHINLAPALKRACTIVNSIPQVNIPPSVASVPPPKPISPAKNKKGKTSARKKSPSPVRSPSPILTPGNYEATSKWNDMVQDDEIERLQRTILSRIPSKEKSASEQQEDKLYNQILPGLANMGNTCFANSVLQCLIHTTALREYCRLGRHSEGCSIKAHVDNKQPLPPLIQKIEAKYSGRQLSQTPQVRQVLENPHFCSFCILEAHVQGILEKHVEGVKQVLPLSVIMLVSKIGGKGNAFKIGVQSDAEEFLVVLIENLYQASFGYLKKVPQSYERQTFIPKLFYFKLEQQRICMKCQGKTVTLADFVTLDLDLVTNDTGKLSGSKNLQKPRGSQILSFDDSLKSFFQVEPLDLAGQCQFCRATNNFGKRYKLKSSLKRFNHNGAKFSDSVDVPNSFRFDTNYLNEEMQRKEKNGYIEHQPTTNSLIVQNTQPQQDQKFQTHKYELYGMVVHDGYSTQSGHYYSLIKMPKSQKWAKFNDEKVTLVEPNQITSYSQKAYLLFYQKTWVIKNDPPKQSPRKGKAQDNVLQPALRRFKTMIDPGILNDLEAFEKGGDQKLNQQEGKKQGNDSQINNNGGLKRDPPFKDAAPAQLGDVQAELSTKLVRLKHNNNNINSSIEGTRYKPSATSRLRSARQTLAK